MMKTFLVKSKICLFTVLLIFICIIGCWEFLSIDQPEFAARNSNFDVPITVALIAEDSDHQGYDSSDKRGYLGIRLPQGWTVEDSISFQGVINGTFIYSSVYSDSLETYERSPDGYYWWVAVSDSIDSLPEGYISFTPHIRTDEQSGVFYLDYVISDRIESFGDYVVHSGPHLICVDAPKTVMVTNTSDNGEGSLRQALKDVSINGDIYFELTYPTIINLDSAILMDRSVSIIGPESGELIISQNGFELKNNLNVNILNLTIIADQKNEGIVCNNSSLELKNMILDGAFIWIEGSNLVIKNLIMKKAFIFLNKSNSIVENVKISGNSDEAGIQMIESSSTLLNVEITNNSGWRAGGLSCNYQSHVDLINCTISDTKSYKSQLIAGGIHIFYESSINIVNSIIWDNSLYEILVNAGGKEITDVSIMVMNSLIKGGIEGIHDTYNEANIYWLDGNIDINPMFENSNDGNYRLKEGSACIDAGIQDTMVVYNDGQDTLIVPSMDYIGYAPDMGAHEFGDPTKIEEKIAIPQKYTLLQNYPNPFNTSTKIKFDLPKPEKVKIEVYNIIGQKIETLLNKSMPAGYHEVEFNGQNLSSGVYLYRIEAGEWQDVRKMVLIR